MAAGIARARLGLSLIALCGVCLRFVAQHAARVAQLTRGTLPLSEAPAAARAASLIIAHHDELVGALAGPPRRATALPFKTSALCTQYSLCAPPLPRGSCSHSSPMPLAPLLPSRWYNNVTTMPVLLVIAWYTGDLQEAWEFKMSRDLVFRERGRATQGAAFPRGWVQASRCPDGHIED